MHIKKKNLTTHFTESVEVPRDGNFQSLDTQISSMNIYQV